jgi:chemotaxis protein MotB
MTVADSPARRPFVRMRPQRDRWVIAYADMITLLLACFASLYAASLEPKLRPSGEGILPGAGPRVITGRATTDGVAHLMPALERLVHQHDESAAVDLAADARGIVISLNESGSFAAGKAQPTASAERMLREIGALLAATPNTVRVEGHTDNVPVRPGEFQSNWDLSTARATRVVQLLIEQSGVAATRLSASGYGEFRPRVANDSAEGRARNRRVDIVVLGAAAEAEEAPLTLARLFAPLVKQP